MKGRAPCRKDVWMADLGPTRGHESAGRRPVLVVSVDLFNHGPADLAIAIPATSKAKGIPYHVKVTPPEGGFRKTSYIKTEEIRSIAKDRLVRFLGTVSDATMDEVEDRLRILMDL